MDDRGSRARKPARRRSRRPLPPSRRRLVPSLERWTLFRLDRAAAALRALSQAEVDDELRLLEVAALTLLADVSGLSQSALSERIGLDGSSGSKLCDELEESGLIGRSHDPFDGRKRLVAITTAGRRALAPAHAALRVAEERFLAPLYEHERDELRDILRHLEPPPPALGDFDWLAPRRDAE